MDAKDYYTYIVKPGEEWWYKNPPARNPHFEKELALLAGNNPFGEPVLRVSWGGTLKSDCAATDTLKYKKLWKGMTGFVNHDSPIAVPVYQTIELGKLRWIIEKWMSIEDALRSGRFSDIKGEDGKKLFRDPPGEGVYNAFIEIESADGKFRDLDNGVLEEVKKAWRYQEDTSLDQKVANLIEDERREAKESSVLGRAAWQ